MCGQYQFAQQMNDPAMRRLHILAQFAGAQLPDGDVSPGSLAPVLVPGEGKARLQMMRWGFPLEDKLIYNARAETAAQRQMFSRCLRSSRCVIPTTGFYEWSRRRERYRFRAPGSAMLYLAGLFDLFDGAPRFTILTCPAVGQVASIHTRQPVVLAQNELLPWLQSTPEPFLQRSGALLQGEPVEEGACHA